MLTLFMAALVAAAPQTWDFKTGSRPVIQVENPGGNVVVTRSSESQVHVEARIDQTPSSCVRYEVEVINRSGFIDAKTQCHPCEGGLEDCPPDFKISIVLRVPTAARVAVATKEPGARQL